MWKAGLDSEDGGVKMGGITNLKYADCNILLAEDISELRNQRQILKGSFKGTRKKNL